MLTDQEKKEAVVVVLNQADVQALVEAAHLATHKNGQGSPIRIAICKIAKEANTALRRHEHFAEIRVGDPLVLIRWAEGLSDEEITHHIQTSGRFLDGPHYDALVDEYDNRRETGKTK